MRFVQIYDWGWDHHGVSPGEDITNTLPIKTQQIDRALTGLITDLKQRGLLDETLIVWGGEFGRTPMAQNSPDAALHRPRPPSLRVHDAAGRRRHQAAARPTARRTTSATTSRENPVSVRDLQATILHLLGLDPWKLSYSFQGLDQRLIGPEGKAKLHERLLA